MKTEFEQADPARKLEFPAISPSVRGFLLHFAQMVLVMEAGMMVYHKLLWPLLLEGTGFAKLTDAYPLVGYWAMVASMTIPMVALMRFYHRSGWAYCLGMTGVMLAPLAMLTVLALCNLCPVHILYGFGDPLMFVAMAVFLLLWPAHHSHGGQTQACHPA